MSRRDTQTIGRSTTPWPSKPWRTCDGGRWMLLLIGMMLLLLIVGGEGTERPSPPLRVSPPHGRFCITPPFHQPSTTTTTVSNWLGSGTATGILGYRGGGSAWRWWERGPSGSSTPLSSPPTTTATPRFTFFPAKSRGVSDIVHEEEDRDGIYNQLSGNVTATLWQAIGYVQSFLRQQAENIQRRRRYYHAAPGRPGPLPNEERTLPASNGHDDNHHHLWIKVLHPMRLFKIALASWILAEVVSSGREQVAHVWHDSVEPAVAKQWNDLQAWWEQGRAPGGLFRAATWRPTSTPSESSRSFYHYFNSRAGTSARIPSSPLLQAWDRQFSPKYQWALGAIVGMALAPVLVAVLSSSVVSHWVWPWMGALILLAEVNHPMGEQIEMWIQTYSTRLGLTWGQLDVFLERVRDALRLSVRRLRRNVRKWGRGVMQSLLGDSDSSDDNGDFGSPKEEEDDDDLDMGFWRSRFPPPLRQGWVIGALIGWMVAA